MPLAPHAEIDRQFQSGPGCGMVPKHSHCGKGGFSGRWALIRNVPAATLLRFKAGQATVTRSFRDGWKGLSGRKGSRERPRPIGLAASKPWKRM